MKALTTCRIIVSVIKVSTKTNAVRLVEQAGIPCREAFYEFDENDLNGMHAAEALAMPPEQVFKTLVARGERTGINVFCIPVCCELDLKKAARAAGDKNMELIAVKELLPLTGYIRGGCSPVGMKKQFVTVYDESCLAQQTMLVSGGRIGTQIECAPADLIKVTRGRTAAITQEHEA